MLVFRGFKGSKVYKESREFKAYLGSLVMQARKECKVSKVYREYRDFKVYLGSLAIQVFKGFKGSRD